MINLLPVELDVLDTKNDLVFAWRPSDRAPMGEAWLILERDEFYFTIAGNLFPVETAVERREFAKFEWGEHWFVMKGRLVLVKPYIFIHRIKWSSLFKQHISQANHPPDACQHRTERNIWYSLCHYHVTFDICTKCNRCAHERHRQPNQNWKTRYVKWSHKKKREAQTILCVTPIFDHNEKQFSVHRPPLP